MFGQGGLTKVFVATRPVDLRKGVDGLTLAVQEMFGLDPFCGAVFVFRSKRADRIKLLFWDQTGMVLAHKRLEGGTFVWPQMRDGVCGCPRRSWRHCSRAWTGASSGRSVRDALCLPGDWRKAWKFPVFAGHDGGFVIHFGPWNPLLLPLKTPV